MKYLLGAILIMVSCTIQSQEYTCAQFTSLYDRYDLIHLPELGKAGQQAILLLPQAYGDRHLAMMSDAHHDKTFNQKIINTCRKGETLPLRLAVLFTYGSYLK